MSGEEQTTETQTTDDAVDIEPIIRGIIKDETKTTDERLSAIEERLGPLDSIGETLEGLFKKNKPTSTKFDEDSLVEKIKASILGEIESEEGNGNGNGATSTGTKRKPGPLSRFLGIS